VLVFYYNDFSSQMCDVGRKYTSDDNIITPICVPRDKDHAWLTLYHVRCNNMHLITLNYKWYIYIYISYPFYRYVWVLYFCDVLFYEIYSTVWRFQACASPPSLFIVFVYSHSQVLWLKHESAVYRQFGPKTVRTFIAHTEQQRHMHKYVTCNTV